MTGYRLTPTARVGLIRVVHYVEDHFGPDIANAVIDQLEHAFERLAERPGLGHRREDLSSADHILFWPVGPTLVAYRARADGIDVLFVERGDLDWERRLT